MRIILDVSHVDDAEKCLHLAKIKMNYGDSWGYWNSADPLFQALVRKTKTGVSVHGRRKEATDGE